MNDTCWFQVKCSSFNTHKNILTLSIEISFRKQFDYQIEKFFLGEHHIPNFVHIQLWIINTLHSVSFCNSFPIYGTEHFIDIFALDKNIWIISKQDHK